MYPKCDQGDLEEGQKDVKIVCFSSFKFSLGGLLPDVESCGCFRIIPVPFAEVKGVLSRINEAQGLELRVEFQKLLRGGNSKIWKLFIPILGK